MRLVGNQGPTLHIIKSEHDHIFGGCAFEKYPNRQNDKDDDKQDAKAFLFQLHPNQVMLKNNSSYNNHAIRCYKTNLSMFGAGNDLRIFES